MDPGFVETGWTLSLYTYGCNSSFTLPSAGPSKQKYGFVPSGTNTSRSLAVRVWRGAGSGMQRSRGCLQGWLTPCEHCRHVLGLHLVWALLSDKIPQTGGRGKEFLSDAAANQTSLVLLKNTSGPFFQGADGNS